MTAPWPTSSTPQHAETTDFRDYLRPIWAHKILILVLVVLVTAGTYEYYNRKPRVYETSTQIFVGSEAPGTGESPSTTTDRTLANQAQLLQTPTVAKRVAKEIGFKGDPRALLGAITVAPSSGTDFIVITATTGSPQLGAELANGFARAFIKVRATNARDALNQQLAAYKSQLSATHDLSLRRDLQSKISDLEVQAATPSGNAEQVSPALPNGTPISPHPKRNAIFGAALSLLLGIIAAFGLERVNRNIRTPEEAEQAYGLPVIATVRHSRNVAPRQDGRASVSDDLRETFRSLRSTLDLVPKPLRTILVTSAVPEEGKSTMVRNLALVYAEAGLRVAVVDADLRRPSVARMLNAQSTPGLANVLMGLVPLDTALQAVEVSVPQPIAEQPTNGAVATEVVAPAAVATNGHGSHDEAVARLQVVASGPRPADPPAMFSAPNLPALLERLSADHDVVLIDSPPLLPVSDTMPLLSLVDGTLLVCRVGTSSVDGAQRVLRIVSRIPDAHVLGLVVNDVEGGVAERYQGY